MKELYERAADFIWRYGRQLEKYRLAFHFMNGPQSAVLASLRTYQNTDCGFGNALEPDKRFPGSTPVDVMTAFYILDEIDGFNDPLVLEACCYLEEISTPEGGIPFTLPMVKNYPHAPWWATDEKYPPASINPTGDLVGLMLKHNVEHPWLDQAIPFCWKEIADTKLNTFHSIMPAVEFLTHIPDQERAQNVLETIKNKIIEEGLVSFERSAVGYQKFPLDWSPSPSHPLRSLFTGQQIEDDLLALKQIQQPDGGWAINWQPISSEVEMEWRGILTLKYLLTLHAYKRL